MPPTLKRQRRLASLRRSFYERLLETPVTGPPEAREPAVLRAVDLHLEARGTPRWQHELVRSLVVLDFVAASAAVLAAVLVSTASARNDVYVLASVAFPFIWVLACATVRAYELRFLGTGSEEYRRVSDAGVRLLALTAVVAFAFRLEPARLYVLVALPLAVVLTLLTRYAARQRLHRLRADGRALHRVVVVGRERSCAELIRQLRRETYAGFSVVGACIDRSQDDAVEGVPIVGSSVTIVEALASTGADTVAVGAWSDLTQADLRRLSWQLEGSGIALVVAPSLTDIAGPRIHIRPVSGLPLLHVEEPEFSGARRWLKTSVDRSVSLVALLLLAPIMLGLALAIRLDSSGSPIFRQARVGTDGKTFTLYKFRSMYVDAEERLDQLRHQNEAADGLLFKMRQDPRVTRVGRWMRSYSLDELPQLINIIKGDMSIVGPRPPLPREVKDYERDVRRRLLVKPGLTGLWQVSGRSDLSWHESVRLDLHYVENWSLALDAMIVWKTAFAVLGKRGAY